MIDDDKLRLLAFEDRWHFVALCCLKADGLLDGDAGSLRDRKIAVKLGVQARELDEIGRRLKEVGLVDDNLSPFAWYKLQYKSDNSTERVKKFREKQGCNDVDRYRNVSVTVQEKDTDTDTEVNTNVLTAKRSSVIAVKPDEISDSLWRDFKRHKGKPFTETALKGFVREAGLAGWTLEAAFTEAIERGWQGFKADWVRDKQNGNNRTQQKSTVDIGREVAARFEHQANTSRGDGVADAMLSLSPPGRI
jgi:hypothetical protein